MRLANVQQNGSVHHFVTVRAEPGGQFTAEAVGLLDVCATAGTREAAIRRVQEILHALLSSGQLVQIDLPTEKPLFQSARHRDANDPEEQVFLEKLAEQQREDLEQTLRELDQECSNSSSTPTT